MSQCTLGSVDYSSAKELLTAFLIDNNSTEAGKLPSPLDIPEETCKKALTFILTGTQMNSSLRIEQAIEWYINTLCETSLSNDCSNEERKVSIINNNNYYNCISSNNSWGQIILYFPIKRGRLFKEVIFSIISHRRACPKYFVLQMYYTIKSKN